MTPTRVFATYWPDRFGIIVREGPEVSEVKWDDGSTVDRFVSNEQLKEVTANQKSKAFLPIPAQEKEMSANQVKEFNDLVAKAQALGIKVQPVKRFKNNAAGEKRLAALKASLETNQSAEASAPAEPTPEPSSQASGEVKESTVAKKSKSKSKSTTTKKAKSNGGLSPKLTIFYDMVTRKNGCTQEECAKAMGWQSVSMAMRARDANVKLRKERKDGEVRYYADK